MLCGRPHWGAIGGKMKKKICILFVFIFIFSIQVFAQNTDLKYYSDYNNDFSGYAVAVYYGNINELETPASEQEFMDLIIEKCSDKMTRILKLTKKNNWLYKQALNEWDYEKGEVYAVICAESKYAQEGILFFVIVKGKNDFLWTAYSINTDMDFDELFSEE